MQTKWKWLVILIILILFSWGVTGVYASDESWEDWGFYSPIELNGENQYKAIFLPPEIYQNAHPELIDLRIANSDNKEVPYYLLNGQTVTEASTKVYQGELVATAEKDDDKKLDFKIHPLREDEDIIGNELQITLPDEKFLKSILVDGSFDGNQWNRVVKDFIYRTNRYGKGSVSLGNEYKYTYYRITIVDNAEEISIPSLKLVHNQKNSHWQDYEKAVKLPYHLENKDKQTIITLENPQHLKVKEINLDAEGIFQRSYSLYDSKEQRINVKGVQELYNLDFKENQISNTSILPYHPIFTDEIIIKIENHDNPPIQLKDINVIYQIDKVVFEDNGEGPYRVYIGSSEAVKPNYDLKHFQSYIEEEQQDKVTLGSLVIIEKPEEEVQEESWIDLKLVFNIIIILISIFIIVLLTRKLSKK